MAKTRGPSSNPAWTVLKRPVQSKSYDSSELMFSGVRWNATAHVSRQILAFCVSLILIRLLSPEPYGLVGMATVVTGFMTVISDFGFSSALIQRRDLVEDHVTSVFWINLGLGLLLFASAVVTAPLVGRFYGERAVEPVLRGLAVVFVLGGLVATPKALLQRRMHFARIAKLEIGAIIISGILGIFLAWRGAGVWSLVAYQLAGPGVEALGIWLLVSWYPRLEFSLKAVGDLLRYSINLTGFNIVNYGARRADDLLIGKYMGSTPLGLYGRAYSLMLLPIRQIIGMVSRVMLPALSALQHDRDRMRGTYLQVIRVVSFLSFPMMAGLAVVADSFVVTILGVQWAGAIPVIRILCVAGAIQTLANPLGWIYTATGRTDWLMWWGVGAGTVLVAAIALGVILGSIESVAWCYAAANLLLLYPMIEIAGRLINMRFKDVIRVVGASAVISAVMGGTLVMIRSTLLGGLGPPLTLLIAIPAGVVLYILLSLAANRSTSVELVRVLRRLFPMLSDRLERLHFALKK